MVRIILGVIVLVLGSGSLVGFFMGARGSFFPTIVLISIGILLVRSGVKSRSGGGGGNPLGLCKDCLSIQLHGNTVRGLINSDAFRNGYEGKLALLFHLKEHNACYDCKVKALDYTRRYLSDRNINIDVDEFSPF